MTKRTPASLSASLSVSLSGPNMQREARNAKSLTGIPSPLGRWLLAVGCWMLPILLSSFSRALAGTSAPPARVFSTELRAEITVLLSTNVPGRFSVYAEDLASSNAVAIQGDRLYDAWSLLKIPVAVTVLRRVGKGELPLHGTLAWKPEELRAHTTIESEDVAGGRITVRELLRRLIALSDNRASMALARLFNARQFQEALGATGMPQAAPGQPLNHLPKISPRHYAKLLRSLHDARSLPPALARVVLDDMKRLAYDSQLPKLLPAGTEIAHMVGYNAQPGDFHDCGIVYHPRGCFILCVMSTGSTRTEADQTISRISRLVYDRYRRTAR